MLQGHRANGSLSIPARPRMETGADAFPSPRPLSYLCSGDTSNRASSAPKCPISPSFTEPSGSGEQFNFIPCAFSSCMGLYNGKSNSGLCVPCSGRSVMGMGTLFNSVVHTLYSGFCMKGHCPVALFCVSLQLYEMERLCSQLCPLCPPCSGL